MHTIYTTNTLGKIRKWALGCFILSCGACSVETSNNGNLDGFWHLEQIDTLQGGSRNMMNEKVYWTFQYTLLNIRKINASEEYFMKFHKHNDSIRLYDPYVSYQRGDDTPITDVTPLRERGINSLDEDFKVLQLSGERMTLQNDLLQLKFRKL